MSRVEESVEVDVPVAAAYNQWKRFTDFPRFMSGVEEVRVSDDLTHWVVSVDRVHREFDARITEQIQDDRIAWASVTGPQQTGVVTFHRLGEDRTRLMLQLDHEPHGLLESVGDLLGFVHHQVHQDLQEFKQFMESRPSSVDGRQDVGSR